MALLRMLAFKPVADSAESKLNADVRSVKNTGPSQKLESNTRKAATTDLDITNTALDLTDWNQIVNQLSVNGLVKELAMNLGVSEQTKDTFLFTLDPSHEHLLDPSRMELITHELRRLGVTASINVQVEKSNVETPALRKQRYKEEKQQSAEQALADDPNVQAIQEKFDATIDEASSGDARELKEGTGRAR